MKNIKGKDIAREDGLYVEEGTIEFNTIKAYEKFLSVTNSDSLEDFLVKSGMPSCEVTVMGDGLFYIDSFQMDYNDPNEIKSLCEKLKSYCKKIELMFARELDFEWEKFKYIMEVDKKGNKSIEIKSKHNGFWDYEDIADDIPSRIIGEQYLKRELYQYKQYQTLDAFDEYFDDGKDFSVSYVNSHIGDYGRL